MPTTVSNSNVGIISLIFVIINLWILTDPVFRRDSHLANMFLFTINAVSLVFNGIILLKWLFI